MPADTDTLTIPSETAGRETTSPPEAHPPPSRSRRAAFGWVAMILAGVALAALAFATFTGGDDRDIPAQGFYPEAEAYEREAHLEGQARTHGGDPSTSPAASPDGDSSDGEFLPDSRHVPTS
ncbi:MAG: hypothetical protein ABW035_15430 [Acidimicrobiales bacterium]